MPQVIPYGINILSLWWQDLRALTLKKGVILVLHGASGLPHELIKVQEIVSVLIYQISKAVACFFFLNYAEWLCIFVLREEKAVPRTPTSPHMGTKYKLWGLHDEIA
jgi:hypothetical protein